MTDAEILFLFLAAFYLAECTLWVRGGMLVFSCQFGRRQRYADLRQAVLHNFEGGMLLGNLLPLGQASITQPWPLSLSPDGVYGYVGQAFSRLGRLNQPERFIRYEDIRSVAGRERDLYINGVHFAYLPTPSAAHSLAGTIRDLAARPREERAALISAALGRHLDSAQVSARLDLFRRLSAELQITVMLLLFVIFLLPPVLIYLGNTTFPLGVFAGSYLGLVLLALTQFWYAHGQLYPLERRERIKHALIMLLSPADAIHSRDKLARYLLGEFSPLAVAHAVCSAGQFQEFAGNVWRDQEYPLLPLCPTPDPGPSSTEAWFREEMRTQLARFLDRAGVKRDEFLTPPPPENADSLSYCPRCLGQYVIASGCCDDCGGRTLRQWR